MEHLLGTLDDSQHAVMNCLAQVHALVVGRHRHSCTSHTRTLTSLSKKGRGACCGCCGWLHVCEPVAPARQRSRIGCNVLSAPVMTKSCDVMQSGLETLALFEDTSPPYTSDSILKRRLPKRPAVGEVDRIGRVDAEAVGTLRSRHTISTEHY